MAMTLEEKENIVIEFATVAHESQKRKYTGEPYITHPIAVAKLVMSHGGDHNQGLAAILHDVVEDTPVDLIDIYRYLLNSGFSVSDSEDITNMVDDLTDEYTKENYPQYNRAERKSLEAKRLGEVSSRSQLIKACDMIDNTSSIVGNDPSFAKVYIKEKKALAQMLTKIPVYLYRELLED